MQNLILPLAACEHLVAIKAANCGLQDELPSLDPMPPTKVDGGVRLSERSHLASSLETLDLSGGAPGGESRDVEGCHSFSPCDVPKGMVNC